LRSAAAVWLTQVIEWWFGQDGIPDRLVPSVIACGVSGAVTLPGDESYDRARSCRRRSSRLPPLT